MSNPIQISVRIDGESVTPGSVDTHAGACETGHFHIFATINGHQVDFGLPMLSLARAVAFLAETQDMFDLVDDLDEELRSRKPKGEYLN